MSNQNENATIKSPRDSEENQGIKNTGSDKHRARRGERHGKAHSKIKGKDARGIFGGAGGGRKYPHRL